MQSIDRKLPVPLYIKTFFCSLYGQKTFKVSPLDPLGVVAMLFFNKHGVERFPSTNYESDLTFNLPLYERNSWITGINWHPIALPAINSYLKHTYKNHFHYVMDACMELAGDKNDMEIQDNIYAFMDKYNLSEIVNYETLKKSYYRHRAKETQELKQVNLLFPAYVKELIK